MAEHHYASVLGNDASVRRNARQVAARFQDGASPVDTPTFGLSDDEFERIGKSYEVELKSAQAALARGNIEYIVPEVEELLQIFGVRLDPTTASYRSLGTAVLTEQVKALQGVQRRHTGEPVETPRQPDIGETGTPQGDTLQAAFQGWKKARNPSEGTVTEYERAIRLFTELHGDMPEHVGSRRIKRGVNASANGRRRPVQPPSRGCPRAPCDEVALCSTRSPHQPVRAAWEAHRARGPSRCSGSAPART
jgi:hypothetical protein